MQHTLSKLLALSGLIVSLSFTTGTGCPGAPEVRGPGFLDDDPAGPGSPERRGEDPVPEPGPDSRTPEPSRKEPSGGGVADLDDEDPAVVARLECGKPTRAHQERLVGGNDDRIVVFRSRYADGYDPHAALEDLMNGTPRDPDQRVWRTDVYSVDLRTLAAAPLLTDQTFYGRVALSDGAWVIWTEELTNSPLTALEIATGAVRTLAAPARFYHINDVQAGRLLLTTIDGTSTHLSLEQIDLATGITTRVAELGGRRVSAARYMGDDVFLNTYSSSDSFPDEEPSRLERINLASGARVTLATGFDPDQWAQNMSMAVSGSRVTYVGADKGREIFTFYAYDAASGATALLGEFAYASAFQPGETTRLPQAYGPDGVQFFEQRVADDAQECLSGEFDKFVVDVGFQPFAAEPVIDLADWSSADANSYWEGVWTRSSSAIDDSATAAYDVESGDWVVLGAKDGAQRRFKLPPE